MAIFPGASLANSEGKLSKVGPLVLIEGSWYGFVPNHTFEGEANVLEAGTGLLVGNIIRQPPGKLRHGYMEIEDAFSVVKFLSYAPIEVSKRPRLETVDPIKVFNRRLFKTEAMGHTAAMLVSIDGPFLLKSGHEIQHYMGAFEISDHDEGAPVAQVGDGGSSIVAADGGQLVGVLLGKAGKTFYCAPAVELLARHFPGFETLEIVA
ncbi:hypothetical protein [Rhizobium sp. MHM7A]|uniref:hypothetical protein n=1 Tax=Rhizobium sp. MHM7A TaxID=2583233 RepID=UPI001106ACC4|nr:hypothetical protein [Rhizobium sp. MHM7A]TLX16045.1 hypothetical protein FFR93_01625 [Rhizobium sp. MHM7A]